MGIPIKLEVFEGPLDLLLHLIDKNKIDIYDIPIVEITDQYMEYINAYEKANLNIISEFMVMAATLLSIKCKMLLPKEVNEDGKEEDPRQELVEKLMEYKMYKFMSMELKEKLKEQGNVFFKKPTIPKEVLQYKEPIDTMALLEGISIEKLHSIYRAIIKKQDLRTDPLRSQFGQIQREEVSVSDKLLELKEVASKKSFFTFSSLFNGNCTRVNFVVTFLAILELVKMSYVKIAQEDLFEDIKIQVNCPANEWKHLTEYPDEK